MQNNNFLIKKQGNKVLIKFDTMDKDSSNRPAQIDVLLDITGVNRLNINDYCEYFYRGFQEFCKTTNRNVLLDKHKLKQTFKKQLLKS